MAELNIISRAQPSANRTTTGIIADVEDNGTLWVTFDTETRPLPAQVLNNGALDAALYQPGSPVLIQLIAGQQPVVMGALQPQLPSLINQLDDQQDVQVRADGKRTVVEARHEIELKCGAGSILLKRNGKIIIKGNEVISRASGANKIKGGSVSIN